MERVTLTLRPDPDDPDLVSCYAPVVLDGVERLALLDTGAARSSTVRRPGLETYRSARQGTGALGRATKGDGHTSHVAVGFAGHDLGLMTVDVVPTDRPGPGDLIGQDILRRWCCRYRLGDAELVVGAPPLGEGSPVVVGSRGHVTVKLTWSDGTTADAIFDTGASVTVVHDGFVREHPELFERRGWTRGTDADGTTVATPMLTMAPVALLGDTFAESDAVSVDLSPAVATAERAFDMILGWPVLRHGTFTIDHTNRLATHSI